MLRIEKYSNHYYEVAEPELRVLKISSIDDDVRNEKSFSPR